MLNHPRSLIKHQDMDPEAVQHHSTTHFNLEMHGDWCACVHARTSRNLEDFFEEYLLKDQNSHESCASEHQQAKEESSAALAVPNLRLVRPVHPTHASSSSESVLGFLVRVCCKGLSCWV